MPENNQILSVEGQLVGMPLAGPESFSQQQLDYLKRALGVDETVLWENAAGATSATLSESLSNFERVRFTVYRAEGSGLATQRIFEFPTETTKYDMDAEMFNENGTYRALYLSRYEVSDLTVTNTVAKHYYASVSSNGYSGNGNEPLRLLKIVGINRISGGN